MHLIFVWGFVVQYNRISSVQTDAPVEYYFHHDLHILQSIRNWTSILVYKCNAYVCDPMQSSKNLPS